ncbi:MAG: AAA family ATPase [Chloroflexota bacterium]
MTSIAIPAGALVVLVGVSGSGKSTFAANHFGPTQVLSSDAFRAIVADDPADQRASRAAFELLHLAARRRLERGRLTVIDATSVSRSARTGLVRLARSARRPAVAIVLDPQLGVCLARNATRLDRTVAEEVVRRQHAELQRWLAAEAGLAAEGFASVHHLTDPARAVDLTVLALARGTSEPPAGTIRGASERPRAVRRSSP